MTLLDTVKTKTSSSDTFSIFIDCTVVLILRILFLQNKAIPNENLNYERKRRKNKLDIYLASVIERGIGASNISLSGKQS